MQKQAVANYLTNHLPASSPAETHELLQLLVYVQVPEAAAEGIALLESAPSQQEQINSGKFGPRDLLESIIEPSKEISAQYDSVVVTQEGGTMTIGRVVNSNEDTLNLQENMLDPNALTNIDARKVNSIEPSSVSMMPPDC